MPTPTFDNDTYIEFFEELPELDADTIKAWKKKGKDIGINEARYLIDFYYGVQKLRIHNSNKISALERDATEKVKELKLNPKDPEVIKEFIEPHDAIKWTYDAYYSMEKKIYKLLEIYAKTHPMYWFFEQTCGIGPVLASSFLAFIDIYKAPNAGHIWSYAGLNPNQHWNKGEKRPWNANLKKACYLAGQSFIKQKNRKSDYYGKIYQQRKDFEWSKNLLGHFKDQALKTITDKNFDKSTIAYQFYVGNINHKKLGLALSAGKVNLQDDKVLKALKLEDGEPRFPMLPPGHIESRARRYAVKLFLSHLHECWFEQEVGFKAPRPYILEKEDENGNKHTHYVPPPQKKPYIIPSEYMAGNEQPDLPN
jgi:hypothetical protein